MLDEWIPLTFATVPSFTINDVIKDSAIYTQIQNSQKITVYWGEELKLLWMTTMHRQYYVRPLHKTLVMGSKHNSWWIYKLTAFIKL